MKKLFLMMIFFIPVLSIQTVFSAETFGEFIDEGTFYVDGRLRYEYVNQDGLSEEAHAKTLRTRIGYKTGEIFNFKGVVEGENVTQVANDDYNDTLNGRGDHPVVADVENTELNQAFLVYSGIPDTSIKGGRQVIALDNQRFIGHVGWRQNNQTFDAVRITNTHFEDTTMHYGYINNVNRIFGDDSSAGDWESTSHFFNISNTSTALGKITAYGYYLDFHRDSAANSSNTHGISLSGKKEIDDQFTFKYYGEYAFQKEAGDNPTMYDAKYYHIAPALVFNGVTFTVGYEVLGSDDSNIAFRTPLATGHKFNGWADLFLVTPAAGLEDFYVDITYKVKGMEDGLEFLNGLLTKFQYHDFSANDGGADYGKEWGIYLKKPINKNIYTELKYADYDTDGFGTDREKITLGLGFKY